LTINNDVNIYVDGIGRRSEDSQMDWLQSVVILRKYHIEILPAATMVSSHFRNVLQLMLLLVSSFHQFA